MNHNIRLRGADPLASERELTDYFVGTEPFVVDLHDRWTPTTSVVLVSSCVSSEDVAEYA